VLLNLASVRLELVDALRPCLLALGELGFQ